jgi:hypothetical protein
MEERSAGPARALSPATSQSGTQTPASGPEGGERPNSWTTTRRRCGAASSCSRSLKTATSWPTVARPRSAGASRLRPTTSHATGARVRTPVPSHRRTPICQKRAGCVTVRRADVDGDGRPDLILLYGQLSTHKLGTGFIPTAFTLKVLRASEGTLVAHIPQPQANPIIVRLRNVNERAGVEILVHETHISSGELATPDRTSLSCTSLPTAQQSTVVCTQPSLKMSRCRPLLKTTVCVWSSMCFTNDRLRTRAPPAPTDEPPHRLFGRLDREQQCGSPTAFHRSRRRRIPRRGRGDPSLAPRQEAVRRPASARLRGAARCRSSGGWRGPRRRPGALSARSLRSAREP